MHYSLVAVLGLFVERAFRCPGFSLRGLFVARAFRRAFRCAGFFHYRGAEHGLGRPLASFTAERGLGRPLASVVGST